MEKPAGVGHLQNCGKWYYLLMKEITLHKQWVVKAPLDSVFKIMTDFEHLPKYFPKVAESVEINKHEGNNLEMETTVKSLYHYCVGTQ